MEVSLIKLVLLVLALVIVCAIEISFWAFILGLFVTWGFGKCVLAILAAALFVGSRATTRFETSRDKAGR